MNQKTNWKIRRWLMFIITIFAMVIIWRALALPESQNTVIALKYSYWTIFAVMMIYVFGVISDEQIARFLENRYGPVSNQEDNHG